MFTDLSSKSLLEQLFYELNTITSFLVIVQNLLQVWCKKVKLYWSYLFPTPVMWLPWMLRSRHREPVSSLFWSSFWVQRCRHNEKPLAKIDGPHWLECRAVLVKCFCDSPVSVKQNFSRLKCCLSLTNGVRTIRECCVCTKLSPCFDMLLEQI